MSTSQHSQPGQHVFERVIDHNHLISIFMYIFLQHSSVHKASVGVQDVELICMRFANDAPSAETGTGDAEKLISTGTSQVQKKKTCAARAVSKLLSCFF